MFVIFISLIFRVPDSKFTFPIKPNARKDTHVANVLLYYIPQDSYHNILISVEALLQRKILGFKNKRRSRLPTSCVTSKTESGNFYGSHPHVLLLNKLSLFSLTQHRFILIQLITIICTLHVSAVSSLVRFLH